MNNLLIMEDNLKIRLQEFGALLNREPDPKELDKTPDGNAQTLPISFVETTLDELFLNQWSLTDTSYQQIFNEIVGTGVLTVIHPITGQEIKRTGFASVVITQDSGAKLVDFNTTKKKNALDLTFPKLKAEILKNAAQSLGKIFGRDLNRKKSDTFKQAYPVISDKGFAALVERIEKGDTISLERAKVHFTFDETQKEILAGLEKPKMLLNGNH